MKKFFIFFFLIVSLCSSTFANAADYFAGVSLEGAFVPHNKFAENYVPIRPSFILGLDKFMQNSNLGIHFTCNLLPIGWNTDEDSDDNKNNVLFGISLSTFLGPSFKIGNNFFLSPGVSMGFALFGSNNSTMSDSYMGLGLNTYFLIYDKYYLGFTADYYPMYHYASKSDGKQKEANDTLIRFGIYVTF